MKLSRDWYPSVAELCDALEQAGYEIVEATEVLIGVAYEDEEGEGVEEMLALAVAGNTVAIQEVTRL